MNALHRYAVLLVVALFAAIVGGCATTQIVSSWKDEDLARVPFRKVLVVFQHSDAGIRRALEDEMARKIANATPSYRVFADAEVRDMDKVKATVRTQGFDSAIIMRLASVEREVSVVPGRMYAVPSYYHGFYGYWGYGWNMAYDPGYVRTDRIVTISTNVYGVGDDKLVFASQSETFNPRSVREAIGEVVKVLSRELGEVLRARG